MFLSAILSSAAPLPVPLTLLSGLPSLQLLHTTPWLTDPIAINTTISTGLNTTTQIEIDVPLTQTKLEVYIGRRIPITTLINLLEPITAWIEHKIETEGEGRWTFDRVRCISDGASLFASATRRYMTWGVLKNLMQGLDIVLNSGHSNTMEIKIYDSGILYWWICYCFTSAWSILPT